MYASLAPSPPIRVSVRSPEERVAANKAKHRRYRERRKLRQQDSTAGITIIFRLEDPAAKERPACQNKLRVLGNSIRVPAVTQHYKEADEQFREEVLSDLRRTIAEKTFKCGQWGHINVTEMCKLLQRAIPPQTSQCSVTLSEPPEASIEALFLSSEDALKLFESHKTIDVPLFTRAKEIFEIHSHKRPVEQLFEWLRDDDQKICVNIPSRSSKCGSYDRKSMREVKERFLSKAAVDDPWNVLDFGFPLPKEVLPEFLTAWDCSLLAAVFKTLVDPGSAQRTVGKAKDVAEWRDLEKWVLLAEAGALTLPHQDSSGYSTWISVYEGELGFGWLSRPTEEELGHWQRDPWDYGRGRWRYVVLRPGKTVFFPSGTVHSVFRLGKGGRQTMATGGHILRWSCADDWLQVLLNQLRHPDTTNEDVRRTAQKYFRAVSGLIDREERKGNTEQLGGPERLTRFRQYQEVHLSTAPRLVVKTHQPLLQEFAALSKSARAVTGTPRVVDDSSKKCAASRTTRYRSAGNVSTPRTRSRKDNGIQSL